MPSAAPRPTSPSASRPAARIPTACVVDPTPDDYLGWKATAQDHGLRLEFCATADDALRLARTVRVDLWVVNAALPDRPGSELCEMLRSQSPRTPVYVAADSYSEQLERSAYRAGAKMFGVKPSHANWLDDLAATQLHKRPHPVPITSVASP